MSLRPFFNIFAFTFLNFFYHPVTPTQHSLAKYVPSPGSQLHSAGNRSKCPKDRVQASLQSSGGGSSEKVTAARRGLEEAVLSLTVADSENWEVSEGGISGRGSSILKAWHLRKASA